MEYSEIRCRRFVSFPSPLLIRFVNFLQNKQSSETYFSKKKKEDIDIETTSARCALRFRYTVFIVCLCAFAAVFVSIIFFVLHQVVVGPSLQHCSPPYSFSCILSDVFTSFFFYLFAFRPTIFQVKNINNWTRLIEEIAFRQCAS